MPNRSYEFTDAGRAQRDRVDVHYKSLDSRDRATLSACTRDWVDAVLTNTQSDKRTTVRENLQGYVGALVALNSSNHEKIKEQNAKLLDQVQELGSAVRETAEVGAAVTAYVGSDVADSLFRWYWITSVLEGCSGGDHSSSDDLGALALGVLVVTALLVALMFVVVLSSANVESLYYILNNTQDPWWLKCFKSVLQLGVVAGFIVPLSMWVVSTFNQAQAIASAATSKMWLMVLSVAGVVLVGLGLGASVGYLVRTWHPTADFNRRKAEFDKAKVQLAKDHIGGIDVESAQETLEGLLTGRFFSGRRTVVAQGYVQALLAILVNEDCYNKPTGSVPSSAVETINNRVKPPKSHTPWLIGTVTSSCGLALAAATYVWYSSSIPALAQIGTVPHIVAITIAALGVASMLVSVVMLVITLRDNQRFFDAQANKDPVVMGRPVASGNLMTRAVPAGEPAAVPMGLPVSHVAQEHKGPAVVGWGAQ